MAGKVSGPGSGPPVGGPADDQKSESPSGVSGARFADKLAGADATKRADDPAAAAGPKKTDKKTEKTTELTADIAAELTAGRIDPKAAIDRVIERVVDKQLGPGAPAAVREKVRAALESAVADDPALSDKIRSLGAAVSGGD